MKTSNLCRGLLSLSLVLFLAHQASAEMTGANGGNGYAASPGTASGPPGSNGTADAPPGPARIGLGGPNGGMSGYAVAPDRSGPASTHGRTSATAAYTGVPATEGTSGAVSRYLPAQRTSAGNATSTNVK